MDDSTPDPSRITSPADLGRELTLVRERAGLTIREVSRRTGLLTSTLGGYFSGRHRPPLDGLERVLSACGCTVDDTEPWRDALLRLRRAPRRPATSPYPGLASYQPADADRFHGRADLTAAVLARIDGRTGPVVVVGASGSGKSSVLRAGVVPALRARPDTDAVVRTPGRSPLAEAGPDRRTVLVVDQFEEIFAPEVGEGERAAFVAALVDRPGPVVIGLRADFYARALAHPELAAALGTDQVVVGPMSRDDLRAAIVAPAADAGAAVDDGLVELLLDDVGRRGTAGALPLLSHALLATWTRSDGRTLTVGDYRATGGVDGAVASSAEAAFEALGPECAEAVRRLFLRLVTVAPDTVDTRRRTPRSELPVDLPPRVLDEFVDRRLLTVDGGSADAGPVDVEKVDTGTVEIAHEALLLAWPRLRGWIDADRVGLVVRRQVAEAARDWRAAGDDPDLLLRGTRLVAATDHAGDELNELESAFLRAGEEQDRLRREDRSRRARRLRQVVAVLGVLVLLAGGLAVFGAVQSAEVTRARDIAVSRQIAVRADALRAENPALAGQLAAAAWRVAPTMEARSSLLNATAVPMPTRMPGFAALASAVVVDPAQRLMASASGSQVQLWSLAGRPTPIGPPVPTAEPVQVLALSPDGRTLAVGGEGGVVTHDVTDPARPGAARTVSADGATSLAFGGNALYAAGAGVRGWDLGAGEPVPVAGPPGAFSQVAVSADGAVVAAGDLEGGVVVWPAADPSVASGPLAGPAGRINAMAFGPDGRTLAAGSTDRSVYRWDVTDPVRPVAGTPLTGPTNWVNAVAFSADGATIAVGSSDGNARLHDAATGAVTATFPHPAPVTTTVFTDADTLVTGEADGVGHSWPVRGPVLTGFGDAVFALDFDDSGDVLAIGPGSKDNTARLWTTTGAGGPRPLGPPIANPDADPTVSGSAALTPDGRVLAVGRSDGSVLLWDVRTPGRPVLLGPPLAGTGALVEQLTISADGRRLAASGDDELVRIWDISDPAAPVVGASLVGASSYVFASVFDPTGSLLAAASADASTYLWDVRSPERPRLVATLDGPASFAYSPAFSPDGRVLAVGSADRTVRLWDVSTPEAPVALGAPLTGPANYVYSVAFAPDGRTLAAASTDGTVWTWDVGDPREPAVSAVLTGPQDAAFSVAWSPDGATLAAGSADRTVRLWATDPAAALASVCGSVGQVLTPEEWVRYVPDLPYESPC